MLYCETYSVYTQNSEKQKAEEQQLAGYVNTRKVTKTDQLCDTVC